MRSRLARLTSAVLLLAATTAAAGSSTAEAASDRATFTIDFPDTVQAMLVDEPHGHLFFQLGPFRNQLVVTPLDGGAMSRPLPDGERVNNLQLSPDGATVWASDLGWGVRHFWGVSTATLEATKYPMPDETCVAGLTQSGADVWVTALPCPAAGPVDPVDASLHTYDLATKTLSPPALSLPSWQLYRISSSPWAPGVLAAGLSDLRTIDVTGGPTPSATVRSQTTLSNPPVVFRPDGTTLIARDGVVRSLSNLSRDGLVAIGWPQAMAVRADGLVAASNGAGTQLLTPSLQRLRAYDDLSRTTALAFGATRLYVVDTSDWSAPQNNRLTVLTPRRYGATLSLTPLPSSTITYGQEADLKVVLTTTFTTDASRTVTIYRTPAGSTRTKLGGGLLPSNGIGYLLVAPTVTTLYDADYLGDADHDGTVGRTRIAVRALLTTGLSTPASRSGVYAIYARTSTATATGTVKPGKAGQCVRFRKQYYRSGAWGGDVLSPCLTLASTSTARLAIKATSGTLGVNQRVRAEWAGDTKNVKNVSPFRYLKFVS